MSWDNNNDDNKDPWASAKIKDPKGRRILKRHSLISSRQSYPSLVLASSLRPAAKAAKAATVKMAVVVAVP